MENHEPPASLKSPLLPPPHERLMAALAHLTIALPLVGWVAALTFWIANRDLARYAAFQAKQACIFQIFIGVCAFASWLSSVVFLFSHTGFGALTLSWGYDAMKNAPLVFLPMAAIVTFGVTYGVAGAIYCAWGLPFRYRFIAMWLRPE